MKDKTYLEMMAKDIEELGLYSVSMTDDELDNLYLEHQEERGKANMSMVEDFLELKGIEAKREEELNDYMEFLRRMDDDRD